MKAVVARVLFGLTVLSAALAGPATASPYTGLYVFGDSLSDVGNVYIGSGFTIPGPPYYAGRFSNGPNAVDYLSAKLGLGVPVPSLAGGTDFAFGGAVTGPAVPGASTLVPNIVQQVGLFTQATGGKAPAAGLYLVWIGGNDIYTALTDLLANTLSLAQAGADLTKAAQTEAGAIASLAGEGAKAFLIPLIPDLGKTPTVTDFAGLAPTATVLTQLYNAALVNAIAAIGPGISVNYVDTFSLVDAAVANPSAFALNDVTDRCYVGPLTGGGTVCATPTTYLFWDGQHPTTTVDALVAQFAANALPEPRSALVLVAAVLGLVGLRTVRKASGRA